MSKTRALLLTILLLLSFTVISGFNKAENDKILSYIADPKTEDIRFYWKDDQGTLLRSIGGLRQYVERQNRQLVFATNGGMYMTDNTPLGLFIENGKEIKKLNRHTGDGNFYMEPNGVLYLTNANKAVICATSVYKNNGDIVFATQSGPMLIVNGNYHPAFKKGSANLNIRSGAGILPDGRILFAISREPINFYDFATYFKEQGCMNALYLDGFVSRAYIPNQDWEQLDGDFGVIIGVSKQER